MDNSSDLDPVAPREVEDDEVCVRHRVAAYFRVELGSCHTHIGLLSQQQESVVQAVELLVGDALTGLAGVVIPYLMEVPHCRSSNAVPRHQSLRDSSRVAGCSRPRCFTSSNSSWRVSLVYLVQSPFLRASIPPCTSTRRPSNSLAKDPSCSSSRPRALAMTASGDW